MFCKDVKNWLIKHQPRPPEGNPLRRLITLSCLIAALTKAERASYKAIGKEMDDNTDLESRIKKAKRWLTNKWTDIFYSLYQTNYSIYCQKRRNCISNRWLNNGIWLYVFNDQHDMERSFHSNMLGSS